jgi:hypothetical protein
VILLAGSLAGSVLYRRRSARRLERVELYAEDGSIVSLLEGSDDLEQVLSLARDCLALPG